MRNITKVLIIILICTLLIWLYNSVTNRSANASYDLFTHVGSEGRFRIYKENITDVMYVTYDVLYKGGLTVMLDTDGTPLLYSEWKDKTN